MSYVTNKDHKRDYDDIHERIDRVRADLQATAKLSTYTSRDVLDIKSKHELVVFLNGDLKTSTNYCCVQELHR